MPEFEYDHPQKAAMHKNPFLVGLLFILFIPLACSFVYLGNIGWPGLHNDAALYGTPVLNVANGKGWLFGAYSPQITHRSSLAYDFHGFLHVFFYGAALRTGTWSHYILAQGIVNSITFACYSVISLYVLVLSYGFRFYSVIVSLLIGSVAGVICIGLQGRPEQLALLILFIPLISILFITNRLYLSIALGFSLAFLVVLSPLIGICFAVVSLFYLFGTESSRLLSFLKFAFLTVVTSVFISAVLVQMLTPFSPFEWYSNVFGIGQASMNFEGYILRFRAFKFGNTLLAPGWNIISILLILAGSIWLWTSKKSWASMFLLALAFVFFNEKMCDYSYTPFIPFGLVLCLLLFGPNGFFSHSESLGSRVIEAAAVAAAVSYMFIYISFLIATLNVPHSQLSPVSALQRFTNSEAGKQLKAGSASVGFPSITLPSMVILGDAGSRYVSFIPTPELSGDNSLEEYERKTGSRVDWFIYPQTATKLNTEPPPSIYVGKNRYNLVDNGWVIPTPVDLKLRPLRLTNRYNFAIYRRMSS